MFSLLTDANILLFQSSHSKDPFQNVTWKLHHYPNPSLYFSTVQVTPNSPKSANVISPEQRQVRYASSYQHCNAYSNDNYEDFGVLGSPVIISGRHYWEVDVSKKRAWILGICGEQCKDIMKFLYDCENYGNRNCRKGYSRYQPENGFWVIGLKQDSVYNARVFLLRSWDFNPLPGCFSPLCLGFPGLRGSHCLISQCHQPWVSHL